MSSPPNDPSRPSHFAYATEQLAKLGQAVRRSGDPERVGRYHILEVIGEGGMGVVYKAEQRTPIHRIVAVKVIKLGMDTHQVIARFEAERQALAVMDHPHVARVIDAGATEDGRPYFVMEYVPGEPITTYADRHQLTIEDRLHLFTQACAAVQHAHQKAIIHRDLKPSNILVTEQDGKPSVKVIDFGVAKAIDHRLTASTIFTETGQFIGTLEYMSPEQADVRGKDIDTRTDVYSLGVVLYELLTGAVPFDAIELRTAGYHEVQRIIREVDPPRPSTRLSGLGEAGSAVAQSRRMALDALEKKLHRELDWIPLKAMRKSPAERYATATELSDDIVNYLTDRPLRAGPESRLYRARKFLRRNKRGVAAAAAMILLLIAGIVATTLQAVRAARAEHQARAALKKAEDANADARAVNDFLTLDVLWSAEPTVTRGRELSVREALDNAARDVGERFKDRPRIEASVRNTLAGAYRTLGKLDVAMNHSKIAVEIVHRLGMADDPDGLQIINDQALILFEKGDYAAAEEVFRRTLEVRRRVLGNEAFVTLESIANLSTALLAQRRTEEARVLMEEELSRVRSQPNPDAGALTRALTRLGVVLMQQSKFDEAERVLRDSLEIQRRTAGEDHPDTLERMSLLGRLLHQRGEYAEAEQILRQSLANRRRVLGEDHPDTLISMDRLAVLLADRGKYEEAQQLAADMVDRSRRMFGPDDTILGSRINNLARAYMFLGKLAEAEMLFREALEQSRRVLGPEHSQTQAVSTNLAYILFRRGNLTEAEPLSRQNIEIQRRVLGNDDPATITSINNLGGVLDAQSKFAESEAMYREALAGRRRILGDSHPETLAVLSNLARSIRSQDRHADAEPLFAELYRSSLTAQLPPRQAALFTSHWGPCLVQLGRYEEAETPLREALGRLREAKQERGEHMQRVLSALVEVCLRSDRLDEAEQWRNELRLLQPTTQPATQSTRPATKPA